MNINSDKISNRVQFLHQRVSTFIFFNLRKEGQKEGSFHGKGGCKLTREGRKKEGSMFKGKEGDFQRKGGRKQF